MEKQQYSLKWSANPPLSLGQLVTFAIAAGVAIVLSWLGVIGVPGGAVGVSALYVAMGFLVPFILWFSGWGLLIAMLAADGQSILRNSYMIDRGYENIVRRLNNIGADIKSIEKLDL